MRPEDELRSTPNMGTSQEEKNPRSGDKRSHADTFEAESDQELAPAPKRADRVMFTPSESDSQHPSNGGETNRADIEGDQNQNHPATPRCTSRYLDISPTRSRTSDSIALDSEVVLASEEEGTTKSSSEIEARHPLPSSSERSATDDRLCDQCRQIDFDILLDPNDDVPFVIKLLAPPLDLSFPETCLLCSFFWCHVIDEAEPGERFEIYATPLSGVYKYANFPPVLESMAMYLSYQYTAGPHPAEGCKYFVRLSAGRFSGSETRPGLIDYEIIRSWLSLCSSVHCECEDTHQSLNFHDIPGFRLIDCLMGTIIPAAEASEREYTTLSYVWGSSSNDSALAATSSLPDKLPLVVDDAMTVTLLLGYRYIWIDRYCIPQDNPITKHDQIRSMHKIYSRSILTLIAAAGNDAEYGLPGVSSRARNRPPIATLNGGRIRLAPLRHADGDIRDSKWHSRGWTFQEALMAKRRLAFTDNQVFFKCQKTHVCDDWELPPNTLGISNVSAASFHDPFYTLSQGLHGTPYEDAWSTIDRYLKRDLTYDSDALNAISGVLNSFPSEKVRFLCGLPIANHLDWSSPSTHVDVTDLLDPLFAGLTRSDFRLPDDLNTSVLIAALLWNGVWDERYPMPSETKSVCVRRREFPSWTWAGWKSAGEWRLYFGASTMIKGPRLGNTEQLIWSTVNIKLGNLKLNWPDAREQILNMSDQGITPTVMTVTGKVFDIQIRCAGDGVRVRFGLRWFITYPPFLKGACFNPFALDGAIYPPPGIFEEEPVSTHDLIALLFTVGTREKGLNFRFMLLRQVGEGANGTIYERVTSCEAIVKKKEFEEWKKEQKEQRSDVPLLQLRTMTVAIR